MNELQTKVRLKFQNSEQGGGMEWNGMGFFFIPGGNRVGFIPFPIT